ncbi:LuxR C-terminal-related transcriptional regulator [Salmonella enterica]|uniref:LuxR C-terminal-related transcriptional regulator n=1 Tax=Salmonella enterica TaxID=28901 RepID=UPI001649F65A|nr:LuxR C-terminal-related transcriptional regulator [Salmonella enterica]
MRETLLRILEWPERAGGRLQPVRLPLPLSPLQRAILEGTLAKKTVSQIARELGVTNRAILASRRVLMTKMGLRNRMELMGLADGGAKMSLKGSGRQLRQWSFYCCDGNH